jgi:hypothetical protein
MPYGFYRLLNMPHPPERSRRSLAETGRRPEEDTDARLPSSTNYSFAAPLDCCSGKTERVDIVEPQSNDDVLVRGGRSL